MQEKGIIQNIEAIHKTPTSFLDNEGWVSLPTRWVVWAKIDIGRVWLRTLIDDDEDEAIKLRFRSLIVREFFSDLIGQEIEYAMQYDKSMQPCYSVQESSLPETYLLDRFSAIKAWFEENRPECLANDFDILRKKATERRKATREKNKQKREAREKEMITAMDTMLAESPDLYLKVEFQEGINRKNGRRQWEHRKGGKLYVLHYLDFYSSSQGPIFVKVDRELVPGKIFLVRRLHIIPSDGAKKETKKKKGGNRKKLSPLTFPISYI